MMQPDKLEEEQIRGIVSDLDGVAYRGDRPIDDSVRAFRAWQDRGVPCVFVTNNSTKSAEQFAAKLSAMGIEATPSQVFTVISATAVLMRKRWPRETRIFAIGEKPLLETLVESGFRLATEDAEIVVLGFDRDLTYAKLRTAVRAALSGATVIVTNPDVLTPADDGFEPCVGALAAAVAAAAPASEQIIVGKPQPFMIEQALAHLGTERSQTVMIGDQLETDILAGQRAGLRSILVTTGVPLDSTSNVRPHRIVTSLLELIDPPIKNGSPR